MFRSALICNCRIIELCKTRNIIINALSNLSGTTQSTVNDIVNGTTYNTGIVTIKKLCDGLNISIREFFDSFQTNVKIPFGSVDG